MFWTYERSLSVVFKNSDWVDYIRGRRFSSGAIFRLDKQTARCLDRMQHLESICKSKRVIHFGFADHLPLIDKKIADDRWLHGRIAKLATKCVGLDIDDDAVMHVRAAYNIDDCYIYDLFKDELPHKVAQQHWDILVLGEVLEHVDNPTIFLSTLREKFMGLVDCIVLTVPNALSFENMMFALGGKECINTDHRYWFSPYTLVKIGYAANLSVVDLIMCGETKGRSFFYRMAMTRIPIMRETIIGVFELRV
jgi:Methyltransferase domain